VQTRILTDFKTRRGKAEPAGVGRRGGGRKENRKRFMKKRRIRRRQE
jgi:hypothetical protein